MAGSSSSRPARNGRGLPPCGARHTTFPPMTLLSPWPRWLLRPDPDLPGPDPHQGSQIPAMPATAPRNHRHLFCLASQSPLSSAALLIRDDGLAQQPTYLVSTLIDVSSYQDLANTAGFATVRAVVTYVHDCALNPAANSSYPILF
ncbi:hypothetical protein U9M48_030332 [Paspalum notatum var. saurae]|uniref:Uncharacterized protein n=1 Tax=Paspalum notatum var. saurae TaxID=547442 RepID=A0AAQ3TZX8_PASNO